MKTASLLSIRRYVDDSFVLVWGLSAADFFLTTLNKTDPIISITIRLTTKNRLPFVEIEIFKSRYHFQTYVHLKKTSNY